MTTVQPIYTIRILQPIIFLWSDPTRKLILFVWHSIVVAGGGGGGPVTVKQMINLLIEISCSGASITNIVWSCIILYKCCLLARSCEIMIIIEICNHDNHIKFTCNIMFTHWLALIVVPTPPYTGLQAYPQATSNSHKSNIPHNCLNGTSIYYLLLLSSFITFFFSMSWSILSIGMLLFNSITFLFAII